ncbi:MAG: NifB/NifX family molybdenum-iron cluster-binding protein [Butyricicoccus sp.]
MIFAVPYENGAIAEQFGACVQFKLYTIDNDHVSGTELLDVPEGGSRISLLKEHGVGILVCHRISTADNMALMTFGVAVFSGMTGDADLQVGVLLLGMTAPTADGTASTALHACGDGSCSGDCSSCRSAHKG